MLHSAEMHLRPPQGRDLETYVQRLQEEMGDFPPPTWDRLLLEAGLTWGTHLGETKLVASITGSPASESMSISLIFTGVGTILCSG